MLGNKSYSDEFGDIALTNSSWRSEQRHGLTNEKALAFVAIPSVIKKGVVIDAYSPGTGQYERIVVAAPITIRKTLYYMGVMLQRDSQNQRLYLHDVIIENQEDGTIHKTRLEGKKTNSVSRSPNLLDSPTILCNTLEVKPDIRSGNETETSGTSFSVPSDEQPFSAPGYTPDSPAAEANDAAYLDAVDTDDAGMQRRLVQAAAEYDIRYSISESFEDELENWYYETDPRDRIISPGYFRVGTVSEPLKTIGVRDGNVYWRKSKIGTIMQNHPEIDLETAKQVPQILENPIAVLKSLTQENSIALFGNVTAANGERVMAALNLLPKAGGNMEAEFTLLASAYGRTPGNVRNLVKNSAVLYLYPDKNRTNTWLMQLRVQFPSRQPVYGSIGTISYAGDRVNITGRSQLGSGEHGNYNPGTNVITLSKDLRNAPEGTLVHEIQHAIQQAEGFSGGSSPEYWGNKLKVDARTAMDRYRNTAGEIEARDAASRRTWDTERRRDTLPDLGDENTVFADGAGWIKNESKSDEQSSIKDQIARNQERLNQMSVVASAMVPENLKIKSETAKWAIEKLKKRGFQVDRNGFGIIYIDRNDINYGSNYADTPAEKAAFAVLWDVLKKV